MSWWIGTYFGHRVGGCAAVFVESDDEPAAAQAIVDYFASEDGIAARGGGEVDLETVFVIPADDYAVYDVGLTALGRSDLQCCGGGGWTTGHSGFCPVPKTGDE